MVTKDALIIGLSVVSLLGAGFFAYQNHELSEKNARVSEEYATTTEMLGDQNAALRERITYLEGELQINEEARGQLEEDLEEEKEKFDNLDDQIREITGTVGQLDKLSKIDPELLQKYSKVYFLNEHFEPPKLEEIEDEYVYDENREHELDSRVMPYFEDMVEDAKDDDIDLWVVSAYRSFDYQSVLKGQYSVTYGSGANTFSADQGYSEHQLGTTIDFTTSGINGGLQGFDTTEAYEWLTENAHKYGFTLSYPRNNAYYIFEPWHWRFVGEELARDLHRDNEHFYDLSQRDIDEYLITLFD